MASEEDAAESTPRPFDVRTVRALVRFMTRHGLNEIDLQEGDSRIRLRRGLPAAAAVPASGYAPPPPPAQPTAAAPAAPTEPAKPQRNLVAIKSPTIGVFYRAREPGAKPLVDVGTRVTPTTVVCLVEAMKLFTDIQAECSGVIAEVVAEDGKPVEYNSVLFLVDPNG